MKRLTIAVATTVVAATAVLFPVQAQASELCEVFHICGDVKHGSDSGYVRDIAVTCDWNDKRPRQYLAEGESATCHDTDGVYVYSGTDLWCSLPATATVPIRETGWHKVTDDEDLTCSVRLD
jgi:hypothetical protein